MLCQGPQSVFTISEVIPWGVSLLPVKSHFFCWYRILNRQLFSLQYFKVTFYCLLIYIVCTYRSTLFYCYTNQFAAILIFILWYVLYLWLSAVCQNVGVYVCFVFICLVFAELLGFVAWGLGSYLFKYFLCFILFYFLLGFYFSTYEILS